MQLELVNSVKTIPRKAWVILGGVLACVFVIWAVNALMRRPAAQQAAALPIQTTPPMPGWRVEATGAAKAFRIENDYAAGKPLFVPSGTEFLVTPQTESSSGAFECAEWIQCGGQIASSILRAPRQAGFYHLVWNATPNAADGSGLAAANAKSGTSAPTLDVMVLTEAEVSVKGERTVLTVNGKSIGGYLDPAKSTSKLVREHAGLYQVPRYFALLTPETAKLRLGPDFELGQLIAFKDFTDKDGHKVFTTERHTDVLPLRMELINKLVKLRERLRQKGVAVTRFAVTSGFRTPDYNRQIHGAAYSRHCYGDGVDLYIDENNDHHMDDLNGDGKLDRKDGLIIANACRELELEGAVVPGGIGLYEWTGDESVRSHVHIDCRGFISRWGSIDNKRSFTWWPAEEFQGEGGE